MNHETRTLQHEGEDVEIDAGIVDMIEAMWALGIETLQSCENMAGWTWVHLGHTSDLEEMLSALGGTDLWNVLEEHVVDLEVYAPGPARHRDQWRYHLGPYPIEDDPGGEWSHTVVVEFPPEHVPAVTALLQSRARRNEIAELKTRFDK